MMRLQSLKKNIFLMLSRVTTESNISRAKTQRRVIAAALAHYLSLVQVVLTPRYCD